MVHGCGEVEEPLSHPCRVSWYGVESLILLSCEVDGQIVAVVSCVVSDHYTLPAGQAQGGVLVEVEGMRLYEVSGKN